METKSKFVWPDRSKLSQGGVGIVKKLRAAGHEAYFAGGAVRDALLKRPIMEIDIATSATPAEVKKLFNKTIPTGEKHGTVTVRLQSVNYEVTTFRSEGPYLDLRRPSKVKFIESAEEDARRRDFTINALFYDPESRQILDYAGGIGDIKAKKIEMVGDPEERIAEDSLRMLRAVRFAATLRFELTHPTIKAIKKHAKKIAKISAERVKQEFDKIMSSDRAGVGIGILDVVGLLPHILPEVEAMKGVRQPRNQHAEGDVYTHSFLALEAVDKSYDLPTRYAVFFHDLGKPATSKIRNNKITFYDHTSVGAEMVKRLCKRLKFSGAEIEKIAWLVRYHLVPNDFVNMKLGTRRKWGLTPHFMDLLRVFRADVAASLRPSGKADPNPRGYREGLEILKEIKMKPELGKPILSGTEVMKFLRIKEGPLVGKVLRALEEKKLSGKIKTKDEAKKFLRNLLDKKLSTL